MGCFTPSRLVDKELGTKILRNIVRKTFDGLKKDKIEYRGIIFFGLMVKIIYHILLNITLGSVIQNVKPY